MKPTFDAEALQHIQFVFDALEQKEWIREYNDRYGQSFISCDDCSSLYWDNGTSYRDKEGKNPFYNPEERSHQHGCQRAAALQFLRPYLAIEQRLHQEADEEEAA